MTDGPGPRRRSTASAVSALESFFREDNLMALRKMAHVCELDLEEYMQRHGIDAAWSAAERAWCASTTKAARRT